MKLKILFSLVFAALLITGCNHWRGIRGSGDIAEEYRDIEEFSKIEVSGAFTVNLTVGDEPSLKISGDDNLLKYVKTSVRGDRLIIETRKNINTKEAIVITTSTPYLNRIDASGANKIKVRGINSENFSVDISGANTVELSGRTEKFYVDMSGATKLYADELRAERVKVDCSGASKAEVYASESLDADASGASKINFSGDAKNVRTDVSGVGRISRK